MKDEFATAVSGASYSALYRATATVLVAAVIVQGVVAMTRGPGIEAFGAGTGLWLGIALLALLITYALMMCAKTTVDAAGIRQSGLIERRVDWTDLQTARLAGFAFSRRLIVRSAFGHYRVFFAGTPALVASFERIAARYSVRSTEP